MGATRSQRFPGEIEAGEDVFLFEVGIADGEVIWNRLDVVPRSGLRCQA